MISLNISKCYGFDKHRSGWGYCVGSLKPFHSKSGIFVDGFLEHNFSWHIEDYLYGANNFSIPYNFPWVGFLHNPPNPPEWFDMYNSPAAIFSRDVFKESLKYCKSIIVLSDYLKKWVQSVCDVPCISLKHPTETNVPKWRPENYLRSKNPTLLQIGYWLRKLESIVDIKVQYPFVKKWLPSHIGYAEELLGVYNKTKLDFFEGRYRWSGVELLDWVSHEDYDKMLTSGVVLLDLYDSSANNAVIECIARNTPLLVNRHPAVVEYCGEDYPLYFEDLDHASFLLADTDRVISAHEYFKDMDKSWLKGDYFANDLILKLERIKNG